MNHFFDELRRRKVTKTAAVYAVAAWVVIEAVSVIFPALQLPDWTVTFIVLLAIIGFPVTLVFAWVFDFTRQGIVRTPGVDELPAEQAAVLRRGRLADFVVIAVLLGIIGWLGWERAFDRDEEATAAVLDSIAVLPFTNMSGDPENEYFGDGLAEELLNALVRIEGLRVAARTSSFEYKGRNLDVRRIGEALNVSTVLEGSVRQSGDRVRVTAQLIRADDGFHLWSETFDRRLEDIFAVQDEISLAIVDALRMTLGAGDRERITAHSTTDVSALESYMRGRFEMNRRTGASLRRAVEHFESAIAADPEYARAYSGLADTWILLNSYGGVAREEATDRAEPYARRALELGPDLAEAHASLGLVLRNRNENAASIPLLERATELNPSYSPAFHWLGLSYMSEGRFDDAVRVITRAVEIDPQYLTAKRALAGLLRDLERHDEADAMWARIRREHASDPFAYYGLTSDARRRGDIVEALRHAVRAVELAPADPEMRALLVQLLIQLNDYERAADQIEIIREMAPDYPLVRQFAAMYAFATLEADALAEGIVAAEAGDDSIERDMQLCTLYFHAGRLDDSMAACRSALSRLGWSLESGEPIPDMGTEAVATMMFAALDSGDTELYERLFSVIEEFFDRTAPRVGPDEAAWFDAIVAAHRRDDIEPMIAILPSRLSRDGWNLATVDQQPIFRPVADDPRFAAIVEQAAQEREVARAEADTIEMPGR